MALSDYKFPDYPRRELRAALQASVRASGSPMPETAMDEIVDLAVHAAGSARRAMIETVERASDPRMVKTASGLAISLIASDCQMFENALRAYAKATGAVFNEHRVEVVRG